MHVCFHVYIYICRCAYIYIHISINTYLHTHTYTRVIRLRLCSYTLLGNNIYNPFPSSFCIVCFAPSVSGNKSVSTFFLDKFNGSHVLFFVKQVGSQFFKAQLARKQNTHEFKTHGSNVCACVYIYMYVYIYLSFIKTEQKHRAFVGDHQW